MLLIFVPLLVVQIVSIVVFFDGSWSRMGRRLSENLVETFTALIQLDSSGMPQEQLQKFARTNFGVEMSETDNASALADGESTSDSFLPVVYLHESLEKAFGDGNWRIVWSGAAEDAADLTVWVKTQEHVYRFDCPKKRIFSSSIFMFVVWMVVTSLLLFLLSVLFLRIQVRAIADLARTAENFGKGIDDDRFKPYGSSEVRKAGLAFIKMKERILRQIMERTQMLAGISHDLRTPLTRMKLMVTMMPDSPDKQDFLSDIDEMEKMLNGYLAFVRGEGDETAVEVDIQALVNGIVSRCSSKKSQVSYHYVGGNTKITAKEYALRRAVSNVVNNACRYAKKVEVSLEGFDRKVRIVVDDNGPGIPEDKREYVFKAFCRLENSRNKETGGIGLGLAITKDIIAAHGGNITLADAPMGGLRVVIDLPS
jgi:two-component system osmolarity sensor histidine kinase EnvZ